MIRKIENDEWVHREKVGKLLAQLGASPLSGRELRSSLVGHALCFLCSFSGWFLPMYFAGRLETRNVEQYDAAAGYAAALGLDHFISELREVAEVLAGFWLAVFLVGPASARRCSGAAGRPDGRGRGRQGLLRP